MPTPYKLKILNGVLKLKTFSDQVLSILGIKDLGTRTGNVTNGVVDWSIQHLTKTTAQWNADTTTILLDGQIGVENTGTTTYKFKIGNGVDLWSSLGYAGGGSGSSTWGGITGTLSNQTDLQSALDGKVDENAAITGATKTKITYDAKGLVTSGTDATTADIADSTNKRYVTDADLVDIGNSSGTNTGDETAARIGTLINGATNYATPLDADKVGIWDVANSLFKALTWANLKATLASTFYLDATSSIQTQLNSKYNNIKFQCLAVNPTDNQNLYLNGNAIAPQTTDTQRAFTFGKVVTIVECYWAIQQSANGDNAQVDVYLRNITTNTNSLLGSFTSDWGAATGKGFVFTGLSIVTSATDYYTIYIDCPTWATSNPTAWLINGNLSYR